MWCARTSSHRPPARVSAGRSRSAPNSLFQVDHYPAGDFGIDEVVEDRGQFAETHRARHILEQRRLEVARQAAPDRLAHVVRALARIDAEQAHAAQDERHHAGVEVRARGEADRADDAVLHHRAADPRQHVAAEVVDRARPGGLVERLDLLEVEAAAQQDLLCTELLQPGRLGGLSGERDHVVAGLRQGGERDRAHPAGGAVDDHRAVGRLEALVLHAHDRNARGVAGGAERHRIPKRHPRRQFHQPLARHARVLRVAAVVGHAELVADADHGVAFLESRVVGADDGAAQIDAAHARSAAQDLALARRRERVLVVHVGVRDAHHHVAGIQIVEGHLDEFGANLFFYFSKSVRLESFHSHSGLMPASFTPRDHFSVSFATNDVISAGGMRMASAPSSSKRLRMSGESRTRPTSRYRRSSTGRGVPTGATMPHQLLTSKPGTPASAMVGTSGIAALRFALLTPSALSLPERMCGTICTRLPRLNCTWPAMVSVRAGPPPLYCTITKLVFDCRRNSSVAMCWKLPMPAAAAFSSPGFCLNKLNRSPTELAGELAGTTSSAGPLPSIATGSNDFMMSCGRRLKAMLVGNATEISSSVCPSAVAFAASLVPMIPPAPPRLSITTLWPSRSPSCWPMARPTTSLLPPGGNGMIRRTGFDG